MSRVADPKAKISLLRAAEAVFAERGLAGAKVEDIARRAGLSKGAFYLHFDSKEAALKQVVEAFLARCGQYFPSPSQHPGLPTDPIGMLDHCLDEDVLFFEVLWQNRSILRILPSCQGQYDYLEESFRSEVVRTTRAWIEYFRSEEIYRSDIDVELAVSLTYGAYNELVVRLVACDVRPPLEQWLRFAQDTFFRAFGTATVIEALEHRNRRVNFGNGNAVSVEGGAFGARNGRSERGRV